MGKKSKFKKQSVSIETIIEKYRAKKFLEVTTLLRKTKFPPQHQKKAAQINLNIQYSIALDLFHHKQYKQCVTNLRMFVERFKKKNNLPLDNTNMLIGLCYLYQNDWDKAASYLKNAANNSITKSFHFYYLLALIYQNKYDSFSAFSTAHQNELKEIENTRQQYLEIAFYIVQQDNKKVNSLLKKLQPKDPIGTANAKALTAIFNGKAYKDGTTFIKPLYKSILDFPLNTAEKEYLSSLSQLSTITKAKEEQSIKTVLKAPIEQLCKEGKPLSDSAFERCLQIPEVYRPYLVYNQIAALFNEDIEDNETKIIQLLKKYEWHFFQVPESLFLFLQIVYWDTDNFSSNYFWKTLEIGLDRFGKTFTPLQLNRLSWRIYGCLEYGNLTGEGRKVDRRLHKLAKAFPQMLGLKLWQLMDYVWQPGIPLPETALDIFANKNFQYGSEIALEKMEDLSEEMIDFKKMAFSKFSFSYHDSEEAAMMGEAIQKMYRSTIDKLANMLVLTTTKYDVHLKNKGLLDLFLVSINYIQQIKTNEQLMLKKPQLEALKTAYHQLLVHFEEDKPESKYFKNYQLLS